jgi:peptidoglycan-associated lipoprotein
MRFTIALVLLTLVPAFAATAGASSRTGPDFVGGAPPPSAVSPALAASDATNRIAPSDDVWFDTNSAVLGVLEDDQIATVATWLREHPATRIVIEGHADRSGTADYNEDLAMRRAAAVRDALVGLGVAQDRAVLVIYGSTDAGDALHDASARRVAMYVTERSANAVASASLDDRHALAVRWTLRGAQVDERGGMTSTPVQHETLASR